MFDIQSFIRKNILKLTPYSSARSEFNSGEGILLDANENPYGSYNRYPDPYQKIIKKTISDIKQVNENQIFLGNGSDEVLDVIMRVFLQPQQDSLLIFPPTYGMYEVLANINEIPLHVIPLNKEFQLDIPKIKDFISYNKSKMAIICSPNNPTGNSVYNIEEFLSIFSGIVVIDEAYIDFSNQTSYLNKLNKYSQLIIIQTFSKSWGLAGIRVGMAFAHPLIIHYMNAIKYPYNISVPNQQVLANALKQFHKIQKKIQVILKNRKLLIEGLQSIKLVKKIFSTDANFVLVEVTDANFIYQSLLDIPIVVRNRHSQIPNTLRITVGTKKEIKSLLNQLSELDKIL